MTIRPLTPNEYNLARWLCIVRHLSPNAPNSKAPVDGCGSCQEDVRLIIDHLDKLKRAQTLLGKIPQYSKVEKQSNVNYLNVPDGSDYTFYVEWSGDLPKAIEDTLKLIDESENPPTYEH